ncbi:MraY family glycosyltransferase [Desulfobacterales bacterium HSG2]|nr:MraY family glycosyltransferase [Desulfobacterales bacterium HSG2]
MTTIILIFLLSLVLSLLLTPQMAKIAWKYNLVDPPSERKVHARALPRIGGVAIYLAFFLSFAAILFYSEETLELLRGNSRRVTYLTMGATLTFALGLADDLWKLSPRLKLMIQVISASVAYMGGIKIYVLLLPGIKNWYMGYCAFPVTVLWFVLVINAMNLIDGLDGLAAGVTLFASLVLLVFCVNTERFLVATALAALGGASLGFLRYNFNPASIFMGDSGSYFLGYMLAALSIMGSMKSQATVAILVPFIAMGLPLMDTILAPIRRFILGQRIFDPDRDHLHHRLLNLGLTHRYTVLILYGVAILMGILSIIIVHIRDDRAALFLILFGIAVFTGVRKLGYFDYVAADKVYEWFRDVSDEAGISRDRRSFLNLQVEIARSGDMNELWINTCIALRMLKFDMAEMYLRNRGDSDSEKIHPARTWTRDGFDTRRDFCEECIMKLELPLLDAENNVYGSLWLVKDLRRDAISHYTLRRVEHLRRTVIETLRRIEDLKF